MSHSSRHNKPHDPRISMDSKIRATMADALGGLPTDDHIRIRAYEISQARNGGSGDARADWTRAEQELKAGRDGRG